MVLTNPVRRSTRLSRQNQNPSNETYIPQCLEAARILGGTTSSTIQAPIARAFISDSRLAVVRLVLLIPMPTDFATVGPEAPRLRRYSRSIRRLPRQRHQAPRGHR